MSAHNLVSAYHYPLYPIDHSSTITVKVHGTWRPRKRNCTIDLSCAIECESLLRFLLSQKDTRWRTVNWLDSQFCEVSQVVMECGQNSMEIRQNSAWFTSDFWITNENLSRTWTGKERTSVTTTYRPDNLIHGLLGQTMWWILNVTLKLLELFSLKSLHFWNVVLKESRKIPKDRTRNPS